MKKRFLIYFLGFLLPLVGNAQIQIQANQLSLVEMLSDLHLRYGLQYSSTDLTTHRCQINLDASFETLEDALREILRPCAMQFQLVAGVYVIRAIEQRSDHIFKGRIVDAANGQALQAVVIEYEGGRTLSDQNGYFSFRRSHAQNRVQFSHIVYQPLDTVLSAHQVNTLRLSPQNHYLEEVLIEEKEKALQNDYGVPFIRAVHKQTLAVGFFLSFQELAQNQPSKPYQIYPNRRKSHMLKQIGRSEYYFFKFSRDSARSINRIYGFSDGENVFICLNPNRFRRNSKFVKMRLVGPYAYFTYTVHSNDCPDETRREVIDLRTGRRCNLNKRFLRPLLAADPALSAEYERKIFKGNVSQTFFFRFYGIETAKKKKREKI